jgi:hypothetical protein
VVGGLWPAELSVVTDQTATLAEFLKTDLDRISAAANDELKMIWRSGLTDSARQAAEARVVNDARARAEQRVESTVRQLHKATVGAPDEVSPRNVARDAGVRDVEATLVMPRVDTAPPAPPVRRAEAAPVDAAHTRPWVNDRPTARPAPPPAKSEPAVERPQTPRGPAEPEIPQAPEPPPKPDPAVTQPWRSAEPVVPPASAPVAKPEPTVERPRRPAEPLFAPPPPAPPVAKPEPVVAQPERTAEPEAPPPAPPTNPEPVVAEQQRPAEPEPPVAKGESTDERLHRLLAFVARQEPRLSWAVGDRHDGTTVLVTDLGHGWIPRGIALPEGVRLLAPDRRTGRAATMIGEVTQAAAYRPGDPFGRQAESAPTPASHQPRELAEVDDLGWELGVATHWRDGLPRMVHTLAKAAAAGSGVVEAEVDLLRVHLDTARYRLLEQYPETDPLLLLNCMLLAATDSMVAGDTVSANYHLSWFQKLNAPPASRWTENPVWGEG